MRPERRAFLSVIPSTPACDSSQRLLSTQATLSQHRYRSHPRMYTAGCTPRNRRAEPPTAFLLMTHFIATRVVPKDARHESTLPVALDPHLSSPQPPPVTPIHQVRPAPVALRPLDSVVAGGGVVPATIVLVQARYGILTYERTAEGGSVHRTPKAQEERLRRGAAAQGEVRHGYGRR